MSTSFTAKLPDWVSILCSYFLGFNLKGAEYKIKSAECKTNSFSSVNMKKITFFCNSFSVDNDLSD